MKGEWRIPLTNEFVGLLAPISMNLAQSSSVAVLQQRLATIVPTSDASLASRLRIAEVRRAVLELAFQALERKIDARRMAAEALRIDEQIADERYRASLTPGQFDSLRANRDRYLLMRVWFEEQAVQCAMEAEAHYDRLVPEEAEEASWWLGVVAWWRRR